MALKGQSEVILLECSNGMIILCKDSVTNSYSIGVKTDIDFEFKFISKKLYELMEEELG